MKPCAIAHGRRLRLRARTDVWITLLDGSATPRVCGSMVQGDKLADNVDD
jgi:hypothetical protein